MLGMLHHFYPVYPAPKGCNISVEMVCLQFPLPGLYWCHATSVEWLHKFYKTLLKGERKREEGRYVGEGRQVVDSALPKVKYVTIFMTSLVPLIIILLYCVIMLYSLRRAAHSPHLLISHLRHFLLILWSAPSALPSTWRLQPLSLSASRFKLWIT